MNIFGVSLNKYAFAFSTCITIGFQSLFAHGSYSVSNLVSNVPLAFHQDSNLLNPWGLYITEEGHLYVADNGTNLITSYQDNGSVRTFVVNALSSPTGLEHNTHGQHFIIPGTSHAAKLILATEEGTILAFNPEVNAQNATTVADRSIFGSIYKGVAIGEIEQGEQHFIYATDFFNAKIDIFDSNFNFVSSFTDPAIPAGFAPFNIQNFHNKLYVTYALQKGPENKDDLAGPGNGFIDIFNLDGTFVKRLISHGQLNSPWGMTLGTNDFGKFSGKLLVGNFGDGKINAFDPHTGVFVGQLLDRNGNPIIIDGLWSIKFRTHRSHSLYFTSGPNDEANGLIGVIHVNHHD